jgi:iron complex transport system substrate-binding protein
MARKLFAVLLTFTFILAACAPAATPTNVPEPTTATTVEVPAVAPTAAPTSSGLTLTDGLGRTVTLAAPAQRVVSMAPSNTEVLFAVGAGSQVVGRDEFSDYPAEAKSLPSIGGSMGQYSYEQVAALKPDLVLASGINTPEQVKALEDIGLTVFYLGNPSTLEELYTNLETVAALTGRESETGTLVDSLKARVKAVDDKLAGVADKPVVFYEIDASDPNKPYTTGPGTFIDLLIARAGGQNLPGLTDAYPQVSLEQIVLANPAIILLGDALYGTTPEAVAARPGWSKIAAVTNDSVLSFDDNLVSRPGPRLVDGLEALAQAIHPEVYK